jgi:hypothetical protein
MVAKGRPIQCQFSGDMVDAAELVRQILPGALRPPEARTLEPRAPSPEVYVSYAWTDESNALVDRLQKALEDHGIRLLRDREEVRYKDSIRDFMRKLGQGKAVVTVISDKFLKSEYCMFEMLEIEKTGTLRNRIFPIVLPDANIYEATGRVGYARYWQEKYQQLDADLKTLHSDNLKNLQEDVTNYADISRMFDNIAGTSRDMNASTDFDELISRIRALIGPVE